MIRAADQVVNTAGIIREACAAQTDPNLVITCSGNNRNRQQIDYFLTYFFCVFRALRKIYDRELIAAVSVGSNRSLPDCTQSGSGFSEDLIPYRMSEGIICRFKIIDIENIKNEFSFRLHDTRDFLVEGPPV